MSNNNIDERMDKDIFEKPPVQHSGANIRPEKDPLNRWGGWTNAPTFLREMVRNNSFGPNTKFWIEQFVREINMTPREQKRFLRPDPVSEEYRMNYKYLMEHEPQLRKIVENARNNANVTATGLTIEQILSNDRHFSRSYFNHNVIGQILARYGCTGYMTDNKSWEVKWHDILEAGDPQFTTDFTKLGEIQTSPEPKKADGYGFGMKITIPFTMMDMASNGAYNPEYWQILFAGEKMGRFEDERLLLGGKGRTTALKGAPALHGLVNGSDSTSSGRASITSPGATYGFSSGKSDFDDWHQDLLTKYHANEIWGAGPSNIVNVVTPGIAAETTLHDATSAGVSTLYQQTKWKWYVSGECGAMYVSQNLNSIATASLTKSTQRWLSICASPTYIRRTVVYPLQRKVLSEAHKNYPDDIAFAYITGDILEVYNNNAIITCGSVWGTAAKCQLAGWRMNGLFMDANTTYQQLYQTPTHI